MVVLGWTDSFLAGIGVLAALGFCLTLVGIGSQTVIQTAVAEDMRARVLSLWAAVAFSAPALGGLLIGVAAQNWGLGMTTVVAGVLCFLPSTLMSLRVTGANAKSRLSA